MSGAAILVCWHSDWMSHMGLVSSCLFSWRSSWDSQWTFLPSSILWNHYHLCPFLPIHRSTQRVSGTRLIVFWWKINAGWQTSFSPKQSPSPKDAVEVGSLLLAFQSTVLIRFAALHLPSTFKYCSSTVHFHVEHNCYQNCTTQVLRVLCYRSTYVLKAVFVWFFQAVWEYIAIEIYKTHSSKAQQHV